MDGSDFNDFQKRALDHLDGGGFGFEKRALDSMDGLGFGFEKRALALFRPPSFDNTQPVYISSPQRTLNNFKKPFLTRPHSKRALDSLEGATFGF